VLFFPLPEAAERAGFRACLRCHPRSIAAPDPKGKLVQRVCRSIEQNLDAPPSLTALSSELGLSPYYLQKAFKSKLGISPKQYAEARRMGQFKTKLKKGESVTDAIYSSGFGSSRSVYERADSHLGMTPATYRKGGPGLQIRYAVVDASLGSLLVAASDRGVCAVKLGDSPQALLADLADEFPAADLKSDAASLTKWVSKIVNYLEGKLVDLNIPLDIKATAFQWRVWEELRTIPSGSTRSYKKVAERLGQQKAARAVARACASNPVALVIPCHRVVHEDGSAGGYRWGIKRKQALLRMEETGRK
jgi:AraC family transcriptional regulator of adaptative response/methylated-DNA-[protein]-cysteine methyltransferase